MGDKKYSSGDFIYDLLMAALLASVDEHKEEDPKEEKPNEKEGPVKEEEKEEKKEKPVEKEEESVAADYIDWAKIFSEYDNKTNKHKEPDKNEDDIRERIRKAFEENSKATTEYNRTLDNVAKVVKEAVEKTDRTARWELVDDEIHHIGSAWKCSNCGHNVWLKTSYCCDCGCRMLNSFNKIFGA